MAPPVRRYEQIAAVLVRYGFEVAVRDLLPGAIRFRGPKPDPRVMSLSVYRRLRLAIQELGPTFIKFGQIISTRRELLPAELIEELKLLTDKVAPVPFEYVKPIIEEKCGPIEEAFAYLNERPFAAASLSQAHHGKLRDGSFVVLKVQRPGIREMIDTDIRILYSASLRISKYFPDLAIYNFPALVKDFARQLNRELDFERDGKNSEVLALNMRDVKGIVFPKIYWKYSGPRLLTMEYMRGVRIDRVDIIKRLGIDPRKIVNIGFEAYMKQIFHDGFFHGDPHPGNLLVTPAGELAILDFGLIGILRAERRDLLLRLVQSMVNRDVNGLVRNLDELGVRVRPTQVDEFKDDLYLALRYPGQGGHGPDSGPIEGTVGTLRKYKIEIPGETMLMIKVILMLQDDITALDPAFDFAAEIKPMIPGIVLNNYINDENISKAQHEIMESLWGYIEREKDITKALRTVTQGTLKLSIKSGDIDGLRRSIDRASYRVIYGLVVSAAVLGLSAVVFLAERVADTMIFQVILVVYVLAVALALVTSIQFLRSSAR